MSKQYIIYYFPAEIQVTWSQSKMIVMSV